MKIKNALIVALCVITVILPLIAVSIAAQLIPPKFDGSFTGVLDDKVDRLAEINEPKIVVVGGSSVAFGLESELIERYTGMPVVNFGLYASLGTKLMLDLSREHINEGDIIVLAPELDAQTLSMYFNSAQTLRAADGRPDILLDIPFEHAFSLMSASWDFAADKLAYEIGGTAPSYEGVYSADSFNEYGDISYPRPENIMPLYYDPNTEINLTPDILAADFCDYLNEYTEHARDKGAEVYFSYCPMNSLAIGEPDPEAFARYLEQKLECTFISDVSDYILEPGYFYDTNFHTNGAGARLRTVRLTEDLLLELGIPTAVTDDVPPPPELPKLDLRFFGEDENAKYFEYARLADGSYMIIGVKDEYKGEKTLTVPLGYDTYKVTQIGAGAFSGTSLEALILTEDTNVRHFMNGAFLGASSLNALYIYYPTEQDITPPADFVGVASSFKVYIPEGSAYTTGYYWSERGLDFEYVSGAE